jgi:2-oxo-4-hydroxy-4-carboxy--5-ureidoimidazoline (OHCU) decarboxylase
VRELPRQLEPEQLCELFGARTALIERLATLENPLGVARDLARQLSEQEQVAALCAHPAIGAPNLSGRSAREQGGEEDATVLAELAALNRAYEERFGFRFVIFVDRRPRSAIVPVLRERLARSREEELATGLDELVAIAHDRWRRG